MAQLIVLAQQSIEGRLACDVDAGVGQAGHDLRGRKVAKWGGALLIKFMTWATSVGESLL